MPDENESCDFCKYCDVLEGYRGKEIPPLSGVYLYLHRGIEVVFRYGGNVHQALRIKYCPMCGRKLPVAENLKSKSREQYVGEFVPLKKNYREGGKWYEARESLHDVW